MDLLDALIGIINVLSLDVELDLRLLERRLKVTRDELIVEIVHLRLMGLTLYR